uniref:Cytochrome P450 94A1 n=1 Tax=Oryza glaberrima TaxID=4538 RepID=A0A0U1WXY6_ORYGL|nr:cytochrome P450 94A1 [Oryza glaberrima]
MAASRRTTHDVAMHGGTKLSGSLAAAQWRLVRQGYGGDEVKKWLNVGTEHRLWKAIADVHAFAMDIVRAQRQSSSVQDRDDLLSRFVASDEHNDEVLRDIVLSFLIAGRETTSSGLSWFFWLLSSQPDVMACITDEVRALIDTARIIAKHASISFSFLLNKALKMYHWCSAALHIGDTSRLI